MQLLEPMSADSPVQKLLDRNSGRGGFAHIAYRVRDIQVAFAHMRDAGFPVIDSAPRPGSRGTTVAFVHPKGSPELPIGGERLREDLDGHREIEPRVTPLVNLTYTSGADRREDLVRAEPRADRQ